MAKQDSYVDGGDSRCRDIMQQRDDFYNSSYPINAAYWQQGAIDKRFKVGDQTLWSLIYGNTSFNQSQRYFFNLIRRHINMICGYQRAHRKSTVAISSQGERNDPLSDDYNQVLRWVEDRCGAQEYYSQSFENAVDVGINLLHLYPDYTLDPVSGDLNIDSVSYNNFIIDPYFRKRDLSDCNGLWRRRWVSRKAAQSMLPGREDEIAKMSPAGIKDGKFTMQAELINLNLSKLYTYDEYYYRDFRDVRVVIDPKTGEAHEWEDDETAGEDEFEQVMAQQPWLVVKTVQKPTVRLCISINSRVMYDGPNLLGIDEYPFVPSLCYYEPDLPSYQWRVQGVVRNMRDAQYLYNRRKVIELQILESQINSGWIYKVDRLVDAKSLRQTGEGFLVPLKGGDHPIADSLQRIDPPGIPESMMALSQSLAEDITKISGVNEELLGSADDDKAGILAMMRQSAGLLTLNGIFDGADYSQRLMGKLQMKSIQKNFTKSKITRILGREPQAQFFSPAVLKYDIVCEEGFYSSTQRQMELKQLLYFKELGMPISDKSILRCAIINNKRQVEEDMAEVMQQQSQQAEQQGRLEQAKVQAEIEAKQAKGQSDLALARERMAKVDEDYARVDQIKLEGEQNIAQADLSIVRQLVELQGLDLSNLRESMAMADMIRQQRASEAQNTESMT